MLRYLTLFLLFTHELFFVILWGFCSGIIDNLTGKKASGQEFNCGQRNRNKNLNTENLKKHRGGKIS